MVLLVLLRFCRLLLYGQLVILFYGAVGPFGGTESVDSRLQASDRRRRFGPDDERNLEQ